MFKFVNYNLTNLITKKISVKSIRLNYILYTFHLKKCDT